jgi:CRP-like cAMP-binding protein
VLLRGRVRLWRVTEQGQALTLRVCAPGEVLGQMSAIDEGPHSVSATAEQDSEVLAVPARAFQELLARQPELALQLARVLAERVRGLSAQLEAMKFTSIGERLRGVLLERGAGRRELRVTHQQLAEQVGATRENVSRVLGFLQDAGVIRLGRGRVELLDLEALARLSF